MHAWRLRSGPAPMLNSSKMPRVCSSWRWARRRSAIFSTAQHSGHASGRFPDLKRSAPELMDANPIAVPGLEEMLKFEAILVEAAVNNLTIQVTFAKRTIDAMLADLAAGRLPGPSSDRPGTVLEIGVDPRPFVRRLEGPLLAKYTPKVRHN